ncbi:MAG: hypothetical protein KDI51_14955 [Xanthomonadales bacterium]|nr:hypothetical protein [Xanthomonadales bacterium]MCB1635885.1 hypothetical protein [Xanthomonadales bacterium]
MADALYLILEEAIDDVGESSEAPAMAKALRKLNRIARVIGVSRLSGFAPGSDEADEDEDDEWRMSGGEDWFAAEEALESLHALDGYVESDPEEFKRPKALRKEFAQLIAILERAAEEGVRFRFEIE